eukprot:13622651-Alexandrium_andersonii.AAC.1
MDLLACSHSRALPVAVCAQGAHLVISSVLGPTCPSCVMGDLALDLGRSPDEVRALESALRRIPYLFSNLRVLGDGGMGLCYLGRD